MNSIRPSSVRHHVEAQRTGHSVSFRNKRNQIVAAIARALARLFGDDRSLVPIPVKAGPSRRPNQRRSRD